MNLLTVLFEILLLWRNAFKKAECFNRAVQHAVAGLCSGGRGTITQIITALGRSNTDWTEDYRLYAKRKWNAQSLFQPIIEKSLSFAHKDFIAIGVDDTKLRKTGKKIPKASWQRDPMGPRFQTNLIWAQRFLQFSHLLPLYSQFENTPPRSLPISFTEAPSVKKPGRKATEEDIKTYREAKKKWNLSVLFLQEAHRIRKMLDKAGAYALRALLVADNGYCNQICFKAQLERMNILARCRKDAQLCFRSEPGSKRFYAQEVFSPEELRQDAHILWQTTSIFHGGQWREIQYKEVPKVLWRRGAGRKTLRLFVIRPVKYRLTKKGKAYYRDPAYLLSTDLESKAQDQIQAYFDRWQIEVNHREEKQIIGVGQAQVRNEQSVHKQPALMVAAYSALLLASVLCYQDQGQSAQFEKAKWSGGMRRPSCRQLVIQLRRELTKAPMPQNINGINIDIAIENMLLKAVA